jgi:hypothetical protein
VKVVSRKSSNPATQRRDLMLSQRTRAAALRQVFPDVAQLQIELVFNDVTTAMPSPQVHTLYPAAPAFFRFVCPCADCDGDFDLTIAVTELIGNASGRKRGRISASGQLCCHGIRLRDRATNKPCSMQLNFQLVASPPTAA